MRRDKNKTQHCALVSLHAVFVSRVSAWSLAFTMSADPQTIERPEPCIRIVPKPKPVHDVTVELQKIRREMLTLASRVEKLANKGQETA